MKWLSVIEEGDSRQYKQSESAKADGVNPVSTTMTLISSHAYYEKLKYMSRAVQYYVFLRGEYIVLIAMFWTPENSIADTESFDCTIWVLHHYLFHFIKNSNGLAC
jgi:hypothetical protein